MTQSLAHIHIRILIYVYLYACRYVPTRPYVYRCTVINILVDKSRFIFKRKWPTEYDWQLAYRQILTRIYSIIFLKIIKPNFINFIPWIFLPSMVNNRSDVFHEFSNILINKNRRWLHYSAFDYEWRVINF